MSNLNGTWWKYKECDLIWSLKILSAYLEKELRKLRIPQNDSDGQTDISNYTVASLLKIYENIFKDSNITSYVTMFLDQS